MPSRILREGILTSEDVNALNWAEEVFYRRLMSVVDDFGRYYASPKLLRAACYPLHIDKVSDSDIGKWLSACETAALVRVYPAPDGKRYLEIVKFNQQVRAKFSKFTAFEARVTDECIAGATQESCGCTPPAHLDGDVSLSQDEGEKTRKRLRAPSKTLLPDNFAVSDAVRAWAKVKGHTRLEEHLESFVGKCKANGYTYVDWDRALMNAISEDWGKIASRPVATRKVDPNRLSANDELERDAKTVGLKRGLEESNPQFRLRVDAAMSTQRAH